MWEMSGGIQELPFDLAPSGADCASANCPNKKLSGNPRMIAAVIFIAGASA
jgi:hypothetical protein